MLVITWRPLLLLSVAAATVGCSDEFANEGDQPLQMTEAGAWPGSLMVDDDTTLSLAVRLDNGRVLAGTEVHWTSSDTSLLALQPATAASPDPGDSMAALLRVHAAAHARGTVVISASITRPGLESAELVDTLTIFERWKAISAGGFHTCGLTVHGDVYCWGGLTDVESGMVGLGIGDGLGVGTMLPKALLAAPQFQQLSAGKGYTCGAASPTGLPYCWGYNAQGQIGDGTRVSQLTATRVLAGRTVISVSAGLDAACATFRPPDRLGPAFDGNVTCWGSLESPSGLEVFAQVSVGDGYACVMQNAGTDLAVRCWGSNASGQFGNGTTADASPFSLSRLESDKQFSYVSTGARSTCGVTTEHEVYCWGDNSTGQLGLGPASSDPVLVPQKVEGLGPVDSVVTSGANEGTGFVPAAHTCALLSNGQVWCWGANGSGQLGNTGAGAMSGTPVQVQDPREGPVRWKAISLGSVIPTIADGDHGRGHTCGITVEGVAYCWGEDFAGQLGDGTRTVHATPVRVAEP